MTAVCREGYSLRLSCSYTGWSIVSVSVCALRMLREWILVLLLVLLLLWERLCCGVDEDFSVCFLFVFGPDAQLRNSLFNCVIIIIDIIIIIIAIAISISIIINRCRQQQQQQQNLPPTSHSYPPSQKTPPLQDSSYVTLFSSPRNGNVKFPAFLHREHAQKHRGEGHDRSHDSDQPGCSSPPLQNLLSETRSGDVKIQRRVQWEHRVGARIAE
eukprot:764794-Hanusia_phi.AAC.2